MFITVSGSLPPGEVVPRQLAPRWSSPENCPQGKLPLPTILPSTNTPNDYPLDDCSQRKLLPRKFVPPRTSASEENCFPPVQLLPKKITLEKNTRTIATMDACFWTILIKENSLEDNFPHPTQSSKIIPSSKYQELTEVHYVLLRVLRFRISSSWFMMIHESALKFQIWNMKIQISFES